MTKLGGVFGSIALALIVTGCGQGDNEAEKPSSTAAPTSAASASSCGLLDAATVEDLAGKTLEGSPTAIAGTEMQACKYGNLADIGVQVAKVPAIEWAQSLPAAVAALKKMPNVDAGNLQKLEDASALIEKGETIESKDACTYFSTMLELQKQEPGSTRIVNYFPNATAPQTINGQQCIADTFSSVSVGRPDIATTPDLLERVVTVLDQLK